ncbi:MAG: hypothetical protein EZS28_028581 [Streblomastix strix]|uniref:Uncharacterized protein n=1 Tax=Streblomastix strix TaxID=222440 RepID=A0A5J4V0L1_9EUKA|nr:MAG: hypothetical protein EZS28_028581 [Streblomastix strix]
MQKLNARYGIEFGDTMMWRNADLNLRDVEQSIQFASALPISLSGDILNAERPRGCFSFSIRDPRPHLLDNGFGFRTAEAFYFVWALAFQLQQGSLEALNPLAGTFLFASLHSFRLLLFHNRGRACFFITIHLARSNQALSRASLSICLFSLPCLPVTYHVDLYSVRIVQVFSILVFQAILGVLRQQAAVLRTAYSQFQVRPCL